MQTGNDASILVQSEAQVVEGSAERTLSRERPPQSPMRIGDLRKIEPYIGKRSVKEIINKLHVSGGNRGVRENQKKSKAAAHRSQQQS